MPYPAVLWLSKLDQFRIEQGASLCLARLMVCSLANWVELFDLLDNLDYQFKCN